jgi:hypothetical protein
MIQPISIVCQHIIQTLKLDDQVNRPEAKVEDPVVRLPMCVDELTEVPIKSDQDPSVADRDGQNLGVFERRLVVGGHESDIMPLTS